MRAPSKKLETALEQQRAGDAAGAEAIYRSILRREPGNERVRYLLAVARLQQGKYASGRDILTRCLGRDPDNPDILFSLGRALLALGDAEAACARFEAARQLAPGRADIWSALGDAHQHCGRQVAAAQAYGRALTLAPDDWRTAANAAILQIRSGDAEAGRNTLRRLVAERRDPHLRLNLATVERYLGNYDEAGRLFTGLLDEDVATPEVRAGSALHYHRMRETERGWQCLAVLDDAALARPLPALAYAEFALLDNPAIGADVSYACDLVETVLTRTNLAVPDRCQLGFALGRLRDRRGEYDAAFDAFEQANALASAVYRPEETEQRFARITAFFSADGMRCLPMASRRSGRTLFIVGMPRSGTSLVEQILDSHPDVAGGGELRDMRRIELGFGADGFPEKLAAFDTATLDHLADSYLSRLAGIDADAHYVSDKTPLNLERLGLIALLFPDARIVHCARDPLDTCLSCYFQRFAQRNEFAYSQAGLGHFYGHYMRLMDHWREVLRLPIHEVRYETLVARPRDTIEALLSFLDLPWDDRCLAFHANPRIVYTASIDQVRRPLYTHASGRAAAYRHRLGPLVDALAEQGVHIDG